MIEYPLLSRRRLWQLGAAGTAMAMGGQLSWAHAADPVPTTPPNVSAGAFNDALRALRSALGASKVFADDQSLVSYQDHFAMKPNKAHAASAAVSPTTVEDIQAVLKVAREFGLPLWTVSTGRNLGYGGPAPRMAGSIVVDLKRMNRILEVNEKHAYAVVEPGVSYFELYQHLQRIGSKLWIDCPAPGWGGVVGNLLDRGVGYTPMGEHFLVQQCGMQVVLSDGTVADTGLASQKGNLAQYTYRYGHGAWIDGLFTQSNFGIVTKLGIQLMPEPPAYMPYMVTYPDEDAIEPLTDAIRPLKLSQLIPNAATSTELIWEAAVEKRKDQYYTGKGPLPDSARRKLMADLNVGSWSFYGALYGPRQVIDATWPVIRDTLGTVKGATFSLAADREGSASFAYRANLMRGVPNLTEFGTVAWIPDAAHVGFGPVVPVDGALALRQYRTVRGKANAAGFDYFGEFVIGWRDMHHIFMPAFTRSDDDEKKRLLVLLDELIDDAAADGFGVYRTHLDLMDKVAGSYSWSDGALADLNGRLKRKLDPAGILAPGKSGIWGRRFTEAS